LMNYYTSTKILKRPEYWPADYHIVGKGINWFHSVIWPSLLMALDLETPKSIFVHSHLIVNGQKMGKSLGNVISPKELIDDYGIDGTRYLLAATIPFLQDSDVSMDLYKNKYSYALRNGIGNTLSRLTKLANTHNLELQYDISFADVKDNFPEIGNYYQGFEFNKVVDLSESLLNQLSQYINENTPWSKEPIEAVEIIKKSTYDLLVISTILKPIMPETHLKIKQALNGKILPSAPLFN
ncbi:MAG: class I tRNA ligase family protein, partial [Romboutsia sp.]|nr:class I tRNA ligase family protein [Romboutsia sp.]